jgi:hypothetical protein
MYTVAEGSFESISMTLPDEVLEHGDYDYSQVYTYSDIDQNYYQLGLGGTYAFAQSAGLFADLTYIDFSDDQVWVYGDQSSDWYQIVVGVNMLLGH